MYFFNEDCLFFSKSKDFSKAKFFEIAKVKPKSYISSLVNKKYEHYFENALSLNLEYKSYYKKEFRSFNEYLNQRYCLFDNEIALFGDKEIFCVTASIYIWRKTNSFSSIVERIDADTELDEDSEEYNSVLDLLVIDFLERFS